MIIVDCRGGLGNQMFQYALYFYLRQSGKDARLGIYHYDWIKGRGGKIKSVPEHGKKFVLNRAFRIDDIVFASEEDIRRLGFVEMSIPQRFLRRMGFHKKSHIHGAELGDRFAEKLLRMDEIYIQGYWQSFSYLDKVKMQLQEKLLFNIQPEGRQRKIVEDIRDSNSVSVHIRRNDYVGSPVYCEQPLEYYLRAMEYMDQHIPDARYFLFSDDMEWCRNHFRKSNVNFVEGGSGDDAYIDMYLMSECKHHIVTNSSFGIWAAWLDNRVGHITIRPQKYYYHYEYDWPKDWVEVEP